MANNISVVGRLAADSEVKHTASGTTVLEFRIADDVGFGDKKVTNWWRCAVWGKQAEGKLADFLKKGQQVVVFGEATMREWEDRDGNKRLSPEIRVNAVNLAGARQDGGGSGQSQHQQDKSNGYQPQGEQQQRRQAPQNQSFDDGDIPF